MAAGTTIAIDFVRRRLRGVEVTVRRGSIQIERAISVAMPEDIAVDDDEAAGKWIGLTLGRYRMDATRVVVAVNREHAVVRTLILPTRDADEVPDMVNLAMKRDLPIDSDDAVIDFIPVGSDETTTEVLACAVPKRIVERVHEVTSAAGIVPSRISLRCFGTATLVNSMRNTRGRSILAIDLGEDGFEFVVSHDGRVGFTRGVETRPSAQGIDETIVTEVRRSWISHRLSEQEGEEVATGVLFAPFGLARRLERWIGEATGLDIATIRHHPRVRIPDDFPGDAWPLAGLVLRESTREPTIDFNSPRKVPDLGARKRQRVMVGIGAILIAILIGWTLGNLQLGAERSRNNELEAKARNALIEYHRHRRDRYRIEHVEAWSRIAPDWLTHLGSFREFAPDPSLVVLDGFTGSLVSNPVRYDDKKKFKADSEVRIQVDGESQNRATIDALRSAIVEGDGYQLRSTGAETTGGTRLSVPFGFQLRSTVVAPVAPSEGIRDTTDGGGG